MVGEVADLGPPRTRYKKQRDGLDETDLIVDEETEPGYDETIDWVIDKVTDRRLKIRQKLQYWVVWKIWLSL